MIRTRTKFARLAAISACVAAGMVCLKPAPASADPSHGIAMYGEPALGPDFESFLYANPDAPKGGSVTLGETGGFDSLHPYIVRGRAPWAMRTLVFESLMRRNRDEPFALYGLIAERIDLADDRLSVVFHLNPEARFSDGSPVTPEDVIWSIESLVEKGRPNYNAYYSPALPAEKIDDHTVRFALPADNRETVMLLALAPIFPKHAWADRPFDEPTLDPLIGSGPYTVGEIVPGRAITFHRREDYWAAEMPVSRGQFNFDEITYLYYKDRAALWQAFRAGEINLMRETDPARWATGYDFAEVESGEILREAIPHGRPTGMAGFVFNTRRPMFAEWLVREALTLVLDYNFINDALYHGGYPRIKSYFGNSHLGFTGAAEGREREILEPFADDLPDGALDEDYFPPADGGSRANLRKALDLLYGAGWVRGEDGLLRNDADEPFTFEILLSDRSQERSAAIFVEALKPLGITASFRLVDSTAYFERLNTYDYDMIYHSWWLSLSPGNEQKLYWGSEIADAPGGRNYPGVRSEAVDAAIAALVDAEDDVAFTAAARALDRALTAGRYVIPFGKPEGDRFAWWRSVAKPERSALYGYRDEIWWSTETDQPE